MNSDPVPDETSHQYLCVVSIVNVPDPIPEEFTYLVCVPEDGVLYFHSGYYTFDAADSAAAILDYGVVVKVNLKGIIDIDSEGRDVNDCSY